MDIGQQIGGFLFALGDVLDNRHIVVPFQRSITEPPISNNNAIKSDILFYKRNQALTRSIRNYPKSYFAKVLILLTSTAITTRACMIRFSSLYIFFSATHKRSIYLNSALTPVSASVRIIAQLSLCSLIPSKSHCSLQIFCTGSSLLRHHPPHYVKPKMKWCTCSLKQGCGDNRGLVSTFGTDQKQPFGIPGSIAMATGACETLRPTQTEYIITTVLLCCKSCFELFKILRIVLLLNNLSTLLKRWRVYTTGVDTGGKRILSFRALSKRIRCGYLLTKQPSGYLMVVLLLLLKKILIG
jgi:hypothetical protein